MTSSAEAAFWISLRLRASGFLAATQGGAAGAGPRRRPMRSRDRGVSHRGRRALPRRRPARRPRGRNARLRPRRIVRRRPYRLLGLEPAGEDGSFFQRVPMVRGVREREGARFAITARRTTQEFAFESEFLPSDQLHAGRPRSPRRWCSSDRPCTRPNCSTTIRRAWR